MIKELSLHGVKGNVDYSVFVRGVDAKASYFYEETPQKIRFFCRGNEFTIQDEGIHYIGTGGSFCEYMFGVEKPIDDFMNREVLNRLIMYGAFLEGDEGIVFTNNIDGTESFDRLFLQGHAVKNYYFFVSSGFEGEPSNRQKEILSKVGKLLKRTELVEDNKDLRLLDAFYERLAENDATVFIFKLIHRANQDYYDSFRQFYLNNKALTEEEEFYLNDIASSSDIDYYQQERMKIDVMYRHPENRRIVDEYRDILLSSIHRENLDLSELARLRRLKTLRIRNNIPAVLFETLDELLLKGRKIQEIEEPDYLRESRSILENLFFKDPSLKSHIISEDIIRLLRAKHLAYTEGDMGFESILLDVGKTCDETARETNDYTLFEEFTGIVTYFDRYDHVQSTMSQMAFTENLEFSEASLRSLLGNKREFDTLDATLFGDLFVTSLINNKYVTRYGKRKIKSVVDGIDKVDKGDSSLKDVLSDLRYIVEEEKLYRLVHGAMKDKLRTFYPRLDIKDGRDEIRDDISKELEAKGLAVKIPEPLFEKVVLDLKKESFYINHLLPVIIKSADTGLREDFLRNSGLDRFYIEGIERDYFEERGINRSLLNTIRDEKELTDCVGLDKF